MKRDQLAELSMQFSVDILNLIEELQTRPGQTIPLQVERSATSICANIAEGKYAQSRADFISKFHIALKEANETGKWLEMLYLTKKIDGSRYKKIAGACATIRILLIASLKTAKANAEKNASNQNL